MKINQKYEKLVLLMEQYDSSVIGSPERIEAGLTLDKLGSKLSPRDYEQCVAEYVKYSTSSN